MGFLHFWGARKRRRRRGMCQRGRHSVRAVSVGEDRTPGGVSIGASGGLSSHSLRAAEDGPNWSTPRCAGPGCCPPEAPCVGSVRDESDLPAPTSDWPLQQQRDHRTYDHSAEVRLADVVLYRRTRLPSASRLTRRLPFALRGVFALDSGFPF